MKLIHAFQKLIAYVNYVSIDTVGQHRPLDQVIGDIERLVGEVENQRHNTNLSRRAFDEARFVVYAWVDECLLSSRGTDRGGWSEQTLQYRFFQTSAAGIEVFVRLGTILARSDLPTVPYAHTVNAHSTPQSGEVLKIPDNEKRQLAEIHACCLGMGFKGCYHNDPSALKAWSKACFDVLTPEAHVKAGCLFPEIYEGAPISRPRKTNGLWKLAVIAVPVLAVCIMFIIYDHWLDRSLTAMGAK